MEHRIRQNGVGLKDPLPENEFRQTRGALRSIGPLLLAIGAILLIIGFIDFFSATSALQAPRRFGLFFIGIPLLTIGAGMTKAGFAGKIARYFGREYGPAVSKTFNEIASDSRDGIGIITEAIREAPVRATAELHCPECGHPNDHDAKFCAACGHAIPATITCPDCGEPAAPEARYCDECGRPLKTPE